MANKTMHHIVIGPDTYEIVDQYARENAGDGVPENVRQALYALFNSAAYAQTGLADEIAVIQSWAQQITAISVSPSTTSITGTGTSQLSATTTPAGGTVTWSSSDPSVATVSSSGLVTGVGNGTATITASAGGKSATCAVTVSGFANLVSISAVYTQSGAVYDTDGLNSLKSDLVVTGSYDDSTTATITGYTLSGTLTGGTSTITVSYGGKTDTFTVTVTSATSTVTVSWSGSGTNKTASPVLDARNADVYYTLPFVSGASQFAEGTTAESIPAHVQVKVYSDAAATELVGYYYYDTQEIESGRTDLNAPALNFDTETKIAPAGYYVKITLSKQPAFTSNSTFGTYLNAYGTTVTLKAARS